MLKLRIESGSQTANVGTIRVACTGVVCTATLKYSDPITIDFSIYSALDTLKITRAEINQFLKRSLLRSSRLEDYENNFLVNY